MMTHLQKLHKIPSHLKWVSINHLMSSKPPFFQLISSSTTSSSVHTFKTSPFYSTSRAIKEELISTHFQKSCFPKWVSSNFLIRSSKPPFFQLISSTSFSVHNFKTSPFYSTSRPIKEELTSTHFQKPCFPKWVSSNFLIRSSKPPFCLSFYTFKTSTFYSSRAALATEKTEEPRRKKRRRNGEAQAALLEYLHGTRGLPFTEAEYISKHSPYFLEKLIKMVDNSKQEEEEEKRIGHALTRYFRYHPINEFEPFFESLGLRHCEIFSLLPQHLMFLSDDVMLLENYRVLCNYGFPRCKIGRIYKEATEAFKYDYGVLLSKLRTYHRVIGFSQSEVIKFVVSSPTLLVGDVNMIFAQVLEEMKSLGVGLDKDWLLGCLRSKKNSGCLRSKKNSYNWSQILDTIHFLRKMGLSKEELGELIKNQPGILLNDGSRKKVCSLLKLLLKLRYKNIGEMSSLLLQIPEVQIETFLKNFRHSLMFLLAIDMEADDIGAILREHGLILGSCSLKRPKSVLSELKIGKKRLCGIIKEDPNQLKSWVERLPDPGEHRRSLMQKTEFLLNLGLVEGSDEMKKAFKVVRGKGGELQKRFDCFVKAGLDPKVVSEMIKEAPHVLNLSEDVIKEKIDFLVNELHYPIHSIVSFPAYISYSIERVKLRFSMYNWLKDEGKLSRKLALSSILASSTKSFVKKYIETHPGGLEVWEKLQKTLSSS